MMHLFSPNVLFFPVRSLRSACSTSVCFHRCRRSVIALRSDSRPAHHDRARLTPPVQALSTLHIPDKGLPTASSTPFLSVCGQQQDRHIPVAKELFSAIQRLLSCCHNEEIALPMSSKPFDERLRISSGGRSFDAQSGRCSQELCFLLRRVGDRLLSLCDEYLLSRAWRHSNQKEGGTELLGETCCLVQGSFRPYAAIEQDNDGLVRGTGDRPGGSLLPLGRMQQQQRGWHRGKDLFGHAPKDRATGSTASFRREGNQLHLGLLFGIRDNGLLGQGRFRVPRL